MVKRPYALFIDINPPVQQSKLINNLKIVTWRHMRKVYGEYRRQFTGEQTLCGQEPTA